MSDFDEARMPQNLAAGAMGGPGFNTTLLALSSGFEKRNMNWSKARYSWTLTHWMDSPADIAAMGAFFLNHGGRAVGFRFQDLADYQISDWQSIGTGNAVTTIFQIFKTYTAGSLSYSRLIKKPVTGTVQVRVNGTPLVEGSGAGKFTVDYTTGKITFGTVPAAAATIEAKCQFDVPVRFDIDKLDVNFDTLTVAHLDGLPIIELRT